MIDVKNALLIVLALCVLAIVGLYVPYLQYTRRQTPPVSINADGPLMRVVYTNKGFKPAAVTVESGTTVEWTNESDKLLWVASDPHPSHTNLPGFDEGGIEESDLQGFVPYVYAHSLGSLYRYTFQKAGTWGYHNHLVPSDRGSVVVE